MRPTSANPGRIFCFSLMLLFLLRLPALASEYSYMLRGAIIEQAACRQLRDDYLLNPAGGILKFPSRKNSLYADINLRVEHRDTGFQGKFRPTFASENGASQTSIIVDESYLDTGISENLFLYAGKKNIRDGVGLGANPTDFLGEGKRMDRSKREEERRLEREGNYLAGADLFLHDITLAALIVPRLDSWQEEKTRFLFKATLLLERFNTDVSLHLFAGDIPGAGLNLSTTINDQLVLHTEVAGRRGRRDKLAGTGSQVPAATLIPAERHQTWPHLVLGGHYTFGDRTNVILEYIYKGDGYDRREWGNFISLPHDSAAAYNNGSFKEAMRLNLLHANRVMALGSMRRHYIFARLSNPELRAKFDGALVCMLNADDGSFLLNPSIAYTLSKNTVISLHATLFQGGRDTEFGLSHWHSETGLNCRYSF